MTLAALVPSGRIVQDLAEPMRTAPGHPQLPKPEVIRGAGGPVRDQPMRIYLPDGGVRVMTLSEYREFLRSYDIEDVTTDEREK